MDEVQASSCISTLCERLELAGHTSFIVSVDLKNQKLYYDGTPVGKNYLIKNKDVLENFINFCSETYSPERVASTECETQEYVTVMDIANLLPTSVEQDMKEMQEITLDDEGENDTEFTDGELGAEDVFTYTMSRPVEDECVNNIHDSVISREDYGHIQAEIEMKTEPDDISLEIMEDFTSKEKSHFDINSSSLRRSDRKRKGKYGVIISQLKGTRNKECPQQSAKSRFGRKKKSESKDNDSGDAEGWKIKNTDGSKFKATKCKNGRIESTYQQELLANSCTVCAKVFKSEMDLQFHKENECGTTSEEQSALSFKCPACAQLFPYMDEYLNHFELHAANKVKESCAVLELPKKYGQEELHADNCLIQETDLNLENTPTMDESNTITEIGTILDTISKSNSKFNKNDLHFCEVCGQTFKKAVDLKKHKIKHNDLSMFPCQCCSFTAKTEQILSEHLKKHHQLFHICQVCGQGFPEKSKLIAHACSKCHSSKALKSHKKSRVRGHTLKCRFCEKLLSSSSNRCSHEKIHLNRRSYLCEFCGRSFNRKGTLSGHVARLHKKTSDHVCSACGKTFKINKYLRAHIINKHLKPEDIASSGMKVYTCKICQRLFPDNFLLGLHMNTHTGEKPYKCAICNKGFFGPGNMNAHHRRCKKNGRKPVKCAICNKGFPHRCSMKTHQKRECSQLQNGPCSTEIPSEQLN